MINFQEAFMKITILKGFIRNRWVGGHKAEQQGDLLADGKVNAEDRAFSRLTHDFNPPIVGLDDGLDLRESQAKTDF